MNTKVICDGLQFFVDQKFREAGWSLPFSDLERLRKFGQAFRQTFGLTYARGETVGTFCTCSDVKDIVPVVEHTDNGNGSARTYDYTLAFQMMMQQKTSVDKTNAPIYRQVVNMNSRSSIDRLMLDPTLQRLLTDTEKYKQQVEANYQYYVCYFSISILEHPCPNLNFINFHQFVLTEKFDWNGNDPHINVIQSPAQEVCDSYKFTPILWMKLLTAPTRDFFESAAVSPLYGFITKWRKLPAASDVLLGCK